LAEPQSLATRTVRGMFWTGSAFALQVLTTLVFYRFLGAAPMGGFEWALIIVMLLALASDLGLGSALVQDRDAGENCFNAAFWTALVLGLTVTVTVIWTAPVIGSWVAHDDARFVPILSVLVLLVPFAAVSGVFRALLQRELRWRAMAAAEIASSVAHAASAFSLLWAGYEVMSAVYSAVLRELALLLGLAIAGRWLPGWSFHANDLRRIVGFGLHLTGSRCISYLNSNLASFVIYPLLGPEALGYFRLAYRLTLMPLVRVSTVIMRVFFPTFSAIQQDDDLLRRAYLRSVQAVALGYWPVLAGMMVLAEAVVGLAGPDMAPAVWPLRLLAAATVIKAVGTAVGSVFLAKGRANWALYWSVFSLIVLAPALYYGVDWGVAGVSGVIAATSVVFLVLSQHLCNRLLGIGFGAYLGVLWRPILVAATAGGLLLLSHPLLPEAPLAACAAGAAVGGAATLVALRLFAWPDVMGMWGSAR
jgi:O-antigen/teichoic acid export membrane protein